jgi:hypothetical protein
MALRLAAGIAIICVVACDRGERAGASPTAATSVADVPAQPPARVQGVVLDFQSATPIAGAVVAFANSFNPSPSDITETSVTDANGRYSLTEPPHRGRGSPWVFIVNTVGVGRGYPRATNYRADVAVDRGQCIARYGMVLDSVTLQPIVGATVHNLSNQLRATTDKYGWYHIDFGCGVSSIGFNTTWHVMSHPNYRSADFLSGRGISGNLREDVLLTPR